jgi:hypothetical protein
MTTFKASKLTAGIAAIALSLSLGIVAPAEATTRPNTSQNTSSTSSSPVWVTQIGGAGSLFGQLEWTPIPGATQYLIHKTGTIRPYWRLFWVMPGNMTSMTVTDKPGAIAVYRITAIVDYREVIVGRFNYRPKK